MTSYVKNPIPIEAVLYKGNIDTGFMGAMGAVFEENHPAWIDEAQTAWDGHSMSPPEGKWWVHSDGIMIGTREGSHIASPGDYIMRGIKGEIYPCKPDIFAESYRVVDPVKLDIIKDIDENIGSINNLPRSRENSLAITNLEQAKHWLNS